MKNNYSNNNYKSNVNKIFVCEIGGVNHFCNDNKSHSYLKTYYTFYTKDNKHLIRFVKQCRKCNKLFIDKTSYKELYSLLKDNDKYKFIPNKPIKKIKKQENVDKTNVLKTKYTVYITKTDLNNHKCVGIPSFNYIRLKNKIGECILNHCITCNKYFVSYNDRNNYILFDKYIDLRNYSDLLKEYEEKEIDKYIRDNFDQFIAKKEIDSKTSSRNTISEEEYFNILNRLKKNNKYDFIVKGTTQFCINRKHKLIDIEANVDVINKDGIINNMKIPAYYCNNCNAFYINDSSFNSLKRKGIILCKIYDMYKLNNNDYLNLSSESIMYSYGYNVNENDDLSIYQRQTILKMLVDNKIMTKSEILSHLNYLYRRSIGLKNFRHARLKWREDIDFINDYSIDNSINIDISSITKIHYIKK